MAALSNFGAALERRPLVIVGGLTLLAALLRFASLGGQSFWLDESATVDVLTGSWGDMFDELSTSEATPPLYYVLAKAWTSLFGSGEAGLRSLSALAGTLTVPVVYLLAEAVASRRAGLLAAVLAAVHPYLIWYSQEARAYALFALLAACSLLFFVRALERHDRRSLVAWTAFSALTMATHYFGGFLVAVEAVWLVARGPRRAALVASGVLAAAAAALLPLVLEQRSHGGNQAWIVERSLGRRLDGIARSFLAGETTRYLRGAVPLAALLASAGAVLLLVRGRLAERRGLIALAGAATAASVIPVLLALADADYVVGRNFIFLLVAALVVLAAGLAAPGGAGRAGMAAALALLALYLVLDVKALRDEGLQRDDWAALVSSLGPPAGDRVLAVYPADQARPFKLHARGEQELPAAGALTAEIDLIGVGLGPGAAPPAPPPGFVAGGTREVQHFTIVRFRALAPRAVSPAEVAGLALGDDAPALLLQRGAALSAP